MATEIRDFPKYKRLLEPGDVDAEDFRQKGFDAENSIELARQKFAADKAADEAREGQHKNKGEEGADTDDVDSEGFKFTHRMILAAINDAEIYFRTDTNLLGVPLYITDAVRLSRIHNAAVVSVGIGVIVAPHLKPPAEDAEDALRRGRLLGQTAVDGVLCGDGDFVKDLQKGRISTKDEEQLLIEVQEGNKISPQDKNRLEAFLVKNGMLVVVAEPHSFSFFSTIQKAEKYALGLLKDVGSKAAPSPKGKSIKNDEAEPGQPAPPPAA